MTARSIVIPCRDEAASLAGVLDDVARAFAGAPPPEVVVVDDGSGDGTGDLAERHAIHARVVRHRRSRGYGEAIKSGIAAATGATVCLMDGDGQHGAADARRLLESHRPRTLVVGARTDTGSGARRWARAFLRWWSRSIAGIDIRDTNSGMMAFDRRVAVRLLPFMPEGMAYSDSFKLLFHLLRMDVTEEPITVRERAGGRSKNAPVHGVRTMLSTLVMVVLINPTRVFLPLGVGALAVGAGWAIPFLVMGHGLTVFATAMILTGVLCLAFGLVFRVLSGITQSLIAGPDA